MLQPENQPKKYQTLFADIDTGRTKIPMFQRDFVWSDEQTARLIDSIIKGFPIGAFIFWQTRDELRHIRNIGNIDLPDTPKGESRQYVLDGQQRITSLYAVRKGVRITREGDEIDYKRISIDLSRDPDAEDQIVTAEPPALGPYITVYELLNGSFAELAEKFDSNELRNRIDTYRGRLADLGDISKADVYDQQKNPKGTQRDLSPAHARDAYEYVKTRDLGFWPEVFLCARKKDAITFHPVSGEMVDLGILEVDVPVARSTSSIAISRIDGNHRLHYGDGKQSGYARIEKLISFCLAY